MPTFCRHNRLLENCPICSKKPRVTSTRSAPRRAARPADAPHRAPRRSASGGMVTRQMSRAPDDGYEHDLVPGLRSSVDAGRLADEIAFAAARLDAMGSDPPGLVGEAARAADPEEATWLLFQIAYLSPRDGDDPWGSIDAGRTSWASGENPHPDAVELGARSGHDPRRGAAGFEAYRAHSARAGGQIPALAGEESWTPQHRFDRAFERLALPGFGRAPRYDFLVMAARLGLVDFDPWTLHLSAAAPTDPIALAAKRVLGIGDLVLLQRRSRELAHGLDVPLASLDLALWNFSSPQRTSAGSAVTPSDAEIARIRAGLGVPTASDGGDADAPPLGDADADADVPPRSEAHAPPLGEAGVPSLGEPDGAPLGEPDGAPLSEADAPPLGHAEASAPREPDAPPLGEADVPSLGEPDAAPLSDAEAPEPREPDAPPLSDAGVPPLGEPDAAPLGDADAPPPREPDAPPLSDT